MKSVLRKIKKHLTNIYIKANLFYCFYCDFKHYVQTNLVTASKNRDTQAASIMLIMHQLEKGMSMKKNPRIFGGDKANNLTNLLRDYINDYGIDDTTKVALNVLYEYSLDEWSTKDNTIQSNMNSLLEEHRSELVKGFAGVKSVSKPPLFNEKAILDFFQSRNSVRDYSTKPVSIEEIEKAKDFAKVTPTACNRQASRVHYYNKPEQIKSIIENQLGAQGWCDRASGIIVVTANQCYFGKSYERYEALIDGGLYAMNLVYGLHFQHIATCFKMFVREPKRESEFKKIANISFNEIPVVLILVGHYYDSEVLEPKSVRI